MTDKIITLRNNNVFKIEAIYQAHFDKLIYVFTEYIDNTTDNVKQFDSIWDLNKYVGNIIPFYRFITCTQQLSKFLKAIGKSYT